jgi:hypothetical protein
MVLPLRSLRKRQPIPGDLSSITNYAKFVRYQVLPSQERQWITGFPSHWLGAIYPSGLFSSPENSVVDVVIEGSAARGTTPSFDIHKELERVGLGQFSEWMKAYWFKGVRSVIHFSRFGNDDGPAPTLRDLASMLSIRSLIRDGTIQRICIQKGIDGPMFLWAMFPRRKIASTGTYDNWGNTINGYNYEKLHRHRAVASLDVIAYSEDEDWLLSRNLVEQAIADAYRHALFHAPLRELVEGTEAFHLIQKRIEPASPMLAPVVIEPLFE